VLSQYNKSRLYRPSSHTYPGRLCPVGPSCSLRLIKLLHAFRSIVCFADRTETWRRGIKKVQQRPPDIWTDVASESGNRPFDRRQICDGTDLFYFEVGTRVTRLGEFSPT
jgi:hypothetical protein